MHVRRCEFYAFPRYSFNFFVYVCLYFAHDMIFQVAHHDGLRFAGHRLVPTVIARAVAVYDAIFLYSRSRFTRPIGRFVPVPATLKSSSFVMSSSSFPFNMACILSHCALPVVP